MKPSVKLVVSRDLERNLKKLSRVSRREVVEEAITEGAEVIAEEARILVPARTGNLRDSIDVSTQALNYASGRLGRGSYEVFVGARQGKGQPHDGFYGHMVEFGTVHSPPQPFIRPAFDQKAEEATEVAVDRLRKEFNRIMKG
ncbi:HK97-gp10 family putative phage morphogenesis protein [Novosphingobium sp. BW1]|uniref:HK97-gp10 family putative phage morphogenesis protein n=1 Tax=Novosphingobium sp. BW1 TaxID=2592621 RepID=UPI0011DEBDE3|nr:HK97-gp10 family putative phage morphogenesis protein [Novosphingobium sp. BW1]TYC93044.1 HK97 gp10 family phage protein [Novosphingobium sp. BW1]